MPVHSDVFRVGVTRDLRRPDGTLAFAPLDLGALERAGIAWSFLAKDVRPLTPHLLDGLDGLYHLGVPVTEASLQGVERLAVLARQGVGLDFVDVTACTRRGVAVTFTPGAVTRPMASAAATLVLAVAHRLGERNRALHAGDWDAGRFTPQGTGLTGRTLGLVGYGRIGHELVRLLAPWEMRVLVTRRSSTIEPGVESVELDALLREADVVLVACPLTDETRGLLDARRLGLMKPTAFLVNVARGAVVDQAALVEALRDGRLAGAALDVVDPEPLPAEDPLLALPNVIGAPHSLGSTDQLLEACVDSVCASLLAVAAGQVPTELANPEVLDNPLFEAKLARFAARKGDADDADA
jgi:phosphoglycerate dehydrogenase-like enzyme